MARPRTIARLRGRRRPSLGTAVTLAAVLACVATTVAAPAQPGPATKRWSGSGNRSLGTVKLTRDSVVRWSSSGRSFSLTDRSGKLKISGRAKSGQSFAVRRTYRGVRVRAKGRWTLTMAPLPAPKS